ncbi:hypothetical protein [Thalassotalea maritima]|uniref:hypothetical protein n=1 Tax=Thalassotalea maritima TaxID=3242416 RepID=UPI0035289B51
MKIFWSLLLLCLSTSTWARNESKVDISIVKSKDGKWTLTYQTLEPASRLSFIRNPDDSRIERWQPKTSDFEMVVIESQEFLVKKDGSSFTKVSLELTPTYKHLSKDYAPFSPYSDGGTLIYTGRLFACVERCGVDVNQWHFSLQAPEGEHIIVAGKVHTGTVNWVDSNDGMNVYVGSQHPIVTDNVIAVIDRGLPERIKLSLDADIPKLMNYFENKLGKLEGEKPTLFASYANINGSSSQGGTLPNQIFMHWNLKNLDKKVNDHTFINDTIWFFAHEVAHLYQRSSKSELYGEVSESWLHEGHADWLAALALLELYPNTDAYVSDKVDRFRAHCAKGLADFPLAKAADKGRFDLYYTCGLLIHQAIDLALKKDSNEDIYSLWVAFRKQVEQGDLKGRETFLVQAEQWTSADLMNRIKQLIDTKVTRPEDILNQLNITQ